MAKDFFKENKVDYTEKDVSADDKAREEMVDKSHQMGVPVIDIDGEMFVGFDRDALSKALEI
jgi:glutaredoxin|tara:strand:- start:4047 stop:4232 length:186 start_codon:yes stop_codon:yes gene_type:complete